MNDDDLIGRLQRATSDVPPSTLDLDAVLRSARRKRVRHRSTLAAGCVAAVAGVGVVAPQVPGIVDDGGAPVASGGAAAGEPAVGGSAGCGVAPVELDWSSAETGPVIRHATRVEVSDRDSRFVDVVQFDAAPTIDSGSSELPDVVRREILDVAAVQDRAGAGRDGDLFDQGTTTVVDGFGGETEPQADGTEVSSPWPPFDGFGAASGATGPDSPPVEVTDDGVYVAYDAGIEHALSGMASCGQDHWRYTLRFQAPSRTGVIRCADDAEATVPWALKRSFCPQGVSDDETHALWSDTPEQDQRTVLRELGLPATAD